MAMATPDWVQLRGGEVRASKDEKALAVYLNGTPLYLLVPVPALGKFACRITQTNNGHRLDRPEDVYASEPEAIQGGLERLRNVLGW